MRERTTATTAWGPWRNVMGWTCPADYTPVFTAEDFRRLPLAPPALAVQPATGEHLVTMPAIAYTQAPAQTLTTDLLGTPVQVEATPTSYTWDFGDGTTITTTSPGHPYPDHDVTHPYTRVGTWTITLTTTYTGRYTLADDPTWHTINGTATTTTTSAPITTVEAPTHLVQDTCTTHTC
ncbi:PKD domain-containing protein [Actinotalea subterranea]|uniref:PKD domain-containing protein n=1 Tax=Actinotalea subterranea TaxID=2607497 RepID=UPI001CAA824F|nr:PKD domain-containing protein [Actinotalea subterranea]